jgi:hypothetical protein
MLPVSLLVLLAACSPSGSETPSQLPYPPAEFQSCFRGAVGVPDRALTVSEVEALWKVDRVREVASQRCGARLLAWYEDLRTNWK